MDSEQFDEALIERLASAALRTWYNANQPIVPSAWERIVKTVLAELSKTHAIVPAEHYQEAHRLLQRMNNLLPPYAKSLDCGGACEKCPYEGPCDIGDVRLSVEHWLKEAVKHV